MLLGTAYHEITTADGDEAMV
jgi:hypothetical protein